MGKAVYLGVDSKARKVKKAYIGVDGKARKIKKMYIGDANGKARLFWSGSGRYVAVAHRGSVTLTSEDGVTWTRNTNTGLTGYRIYDYAYGNGVYVTLISNAGEEVGINAYYSTDGVTWTLSKQFASSSYQGTMSFCNGRFIVYHNAGRFFTSTNGKTWTDLGYTSSISIYSNVVYAKYNGSYYYIVVGHAYNSSTGLSQDGVFISSDLINWTNVWQTNASGSIGSKCGVECINNTAYASFFYGNSMFSLVKVNPSGTGGTLITSVSKSQGTNRVKSVGNDDDDVIVAGYITYGSDVIAPTPTYASYYNRVGVDTGWVNLNISSAATVNNTMPISYCGGKYYAHFEPQAYSPSDAHSYLYYANGFSGLKSGITLCYQGNYGVPGTITSVAGVMYGD